jgi:hypothetical protein
MFRVKNLKAVKPIGQPLKIRLLSRAYGWLMTFELTPSPHLIRYLPNYSMNANEIGMNEMKLHVQFHFIHWLSYDVGLVYDKENLASDKPSGAGASLSCTYAARKYITESYTL